MKTTFLQILLRAEVNKTFLLTENLALITALLSLKPKPVFYNSQLL